MSSPAGWFRAVFQRELGVSPAEYRRQIRMRG